MPRCEIAAWLHVQARTSFQQSMLWQNRAAKQCCYNVTTRGNLFILKLLMLLAGFGMSLDAKGGLAEGSMTLHVMSRLSG